MKILFTGGGTGGHIFPIIAILREIKKFSSEEEGAKPLYLSYLGPKDKLSLQLLLREKVKARTIPTGKMRRYFTPFAIFQNIIDLFFKIPLGTFLAFWHLFFGAPDVIFSKGGYGSLPVVLAGWTLRIPIILHESDAIAGFANRLIGRFAIEIFTSFEKTENLPSNKTLVVGNPIREELLKGSPQKGKEFFKLTGEKPVLLIIGGSQGAQAINELVLNILNEWVQDFEIIHISGPKNFEQIEKESLALLKPEFQRYYHLFGFLDEEELASAYAACHLIISRAGSGSIFEIAALGKPSILIPLEGSAQDHQLKNAYAYQRAGATIVIEQANLTPHFLLEKAKYLLSHPDEYQKLSKKAWEFSRPKAAKIIAEYLIAFLNY